MTNNKDTASFFENGTTDQFEYCFQLYPQVLKLKAEKRCKKPQELIRLDQWYQNELPKLIKGRGKDAHMVYDELVQTMKWKQTRGKFYPQLSYLVKVNTPRAVIAETKKAFRKLPNLEQAVAALSNLKGVGTTMASALLAAAAPDSAPFMADECLMAIPEIEGIDYTTKEYLNFVQHIQTTVERLNAETAGGGGDPKWSPHRVELALWAHYVANDLSPELLDEMPAANAKAAAANGSGDGIKTIVSVGEGGEEVNDENSTGKIVAAGDDDTNDNDDTNESLTAVRAVDANNTATESETDNENTNPMPQLLANNNVSSSSGALQDGDSNFISNDSTSQEEIQNNANILDEENTTQTTATTSTDDGEIGTTTPLASDSESNIDLPGSGKANNNNIATTAAQASVVVVDDAATATEPTAGNQVHSSSNGSKILNAEVIGNGNGNGALLDGENSSCLRSRSSANEEASEEYDEGDDESNSNSVSGGGCVNLKAAAAAHLVESNAAAAVATVTNVVSSSMVGQKRSLVQSINDEPPQEQQQQPEMKKARSD